MCALARKSYRRMCDNIKESYENTAKLFDQVYQKMLSDVDYIESLTNDALLSKDNKTFLSQFKQFQRELEDVIGEYQLKLQELDMTPVINTDVTITNTANTSTTLCHSVDSPNIKNETATSTTQTDMENDCVEDTKMSPPKCATFSYEEYLAQRTTEDVLLAQKFYSLTRSSSCSSCSYENFSTENTLSRHSSSISLNTNYPSSINSFKTCSDESSSNVENTTETVCNSPPSVIEVIKRDYTAKDKPVKNNTELICNSQPPMTEVTKEVCIAQDEPTKIDITKEIATPRQEMKILDQPASSPKKLDIDISSYVLNFEKKKKSEEAHRHKENSNSFINLKIVKKLRPEKNSPMQSTTSGSTGSCSNESTPTNARKPNNYHQINKCMDNLKTNAVKFELKNKRAPAIKDKCFISHIKSPSEFYIITLDSYFPFIDRMTQDISSAYNQSLGVTWFESKIRARNAIRNCCVAYVDSWEEWCRVEVTDWCHNDNTHVEIFLVDYGYGEKVHYNNLRQMLECFTEVPKSVQKCHLANVTPISNEWSEEAIRIFGTYTKKFLSVNNVSWENGSYAVELTNLEDNSDIELELIKAGVAKILDDEKIMTDPFMLGQIKSALGLSDDCDDYEDDENDQDLEQLIESRNVNEAVIGYDPKDCERYCGFVRPDGTCFKGKNCKLEHDPQAKEMLRYVATLDRGIYHTFHDPFAVVDSIGVEVDLVVKYIVSVKKFYAQIHDASNQTQFFRNMNLPSVISRYEKISPGDVVCLADVVAVYIEKDQMWYRAVIRSIDYCKEEYEVFLVDFGDLCVCTKKDLRKLPDIFFNLPPQAIECNLFNVRTKNDVDQSEAIKYFENLAVEKIFHADVIYKDGSLTVKLENKEGEDIGEKLVQAGYADIETEIITPSSNCAVLVD